MPHILLPSNAINWGQPVNRASPLNRGLVAWWHGRTGIAGNSWTDLIKKTETTPVGTPSWSAMGQDGMAINFSGTTDHVECSGQAISSALHGSSQITVSAEMVYDTLPSATQFGNVLVDVYIASGKNGLYLNIRGDGGSANKVLIGGRSQSADAFQLATSASALTAATRYSIGGILDIANDTITPFINGVRDSPTAAVFGASTYTHTSSSQNDSLGGLDNSTLCFDGRIKNIRIWNRALSADEVYQVYVDFLTGYQRTLNRLTRTFAYSIGAAATFNAGWARNSTTLIGAGSYA